MEIRSKLAVILHADVVGSTTLVQKNEGIAHERIQDAFYRFSQVIADYSGVTIELRGDALVAEFERASDAVAAALCFQAENEQKNLELEGDIRPVLRTGIALGEVIVANNTVTGAGVVLAQRLEQLVKPGGVCISAATREALPARLPYRYTSLGEQTLKGFEEPVKVISVDLEDGSTLPAPEPISLAKANRYPRRGTWSVKAFAAIILLVTVGIGFLLWQQPWNAGVERADPSRMAHSLPELPSVAVLPFRNVSEDVEHAVFADGVTEDIITDLSKISGLFVVARGSTFEYRNSATSPRQVAEDLGVRYVLNGSVRRAGDSIRVTAQLVDTLYGNHLWSERYDSRLQDVFAVQSEVAARVVKALAVTLKSGEHERLFQKYTTNIDAYDVFIRARRVVDVPSRSSIEQGEALFEQVIKLDPDFAGGYAGLSFNYSVKARFGFGEPGTADVKKALDLGMEAIRIDPQFGWSYVALGGAQLAARDPAAAVETMRKALVLLPGDYEVQLFTGLYLQFSGEPAEAIKHLEIARRMNPVDTDRNLSFLGMAYFMEKDYVKAEAFWKRRLEKFPVGNPLPLIFLASTHALQGNVVEANNVAAKLRASFPDFKLEEWGWVFSYRIPENRERLLRAASMAGIP